MRSYRAPYFGRVFIAILATSLLTTARGFSESDPNENPCNGSTLNTDASMLDQGCPVTIKAKTLKNHDIAMSLQLPAPSSKQGKIALGLAADKTHFQLGELEADLLVVMVFDMYCHVCHQSSENMQAVADRLQNDPNIKSVCILGLGRGDTDFEVQTFVKKLELEFTCVADRDKSVTDALGVRFTPSGFLFCRKTGEYRLLSSFSGYLSKPKVEEFLAPVLSANH
ncbi:MAG: peroxiredoxin family protein [Opitutaceae bacterium]